MADWSLPTLTSTYTSVLDTLKLRDNDAAVQFSPTYSTATNLPTGTIRWNPTNGYWEIRAAGGTWSALQAKYMIDVDTLDGQHGSYYNAWGNLTGVPSTFPPSAHTHDDRYYTETEADARFGNNLTTSGNTIILRTPGNVALSTITVPYATNAGTVAGFSIGQNLLTTSPVTFASMVAASLTSSSALALLATGANPITASTNSLERLRIHASGGVSIGNTVDPGNTNLSVTGSIAGASLTLGGTAITATAAELNYLSGVTSAIQTQLNGKQATITGAVSGLTATNLTASRALVSDASGKVTVSAVTATELGYLSGVTSAVQTQLNTKAPLAAPTFTGIAVADFLRLPTTSSVSLTSTGHALQIGYDTNFNLAFDDRAVQSRYNGTAAVLYLNASGGNVFIGSGTSFVTIPGTLSPAAITLPGSCVFSSTIQDAAVITSKIADNAITAAKIAANSVGSSEADIATASQAISGNTGSGGTISLPASVMNWGTNATSSVELDPRGTASSPTLKWYAGSTVSSGAYVYWSYLA